MKTGSAHAATEEHIAIAVHAPRLPVDARIPHPRRIAGDDVEAAGCDHVREMHVERKEVENTLLDALECRARVRDARLELVTSKLIDASAIAEEILRWCARRCELVLIGF